MTDQLTSALIVANLVSVVVGLACYVWYGFALSRLFPKLGAEGWRGWVPILNEIEILVRGGVPGWNVIFSFIPIVQLYGIYLKAMAVHRINESFGKGAGYTVLGIFLPPLWATLLARGRMPADGAYDRRVEALMTHPGGSAPSFGADALGASDVQAPPAPPVYASAPPPPRPAAVSVSFPSLAAASEPRLFAEPIAPPVAPPAPAPVPASAPVEAEGSVYHPWASGPPAPPAAPPVAVPPTAPAAPEPVVVAPSVDVTAATDEDEDDELDKTVAVDRRPVVPWRLLTDEGHVIPLRARTVLLGRKPVSPNDGIAAVAVPDSTKTLSKNHARLELSDDGTWTVYDLNSTNGVIIVESDGTETLLPEGGSAPVPGRFLLGTVAMRLTFDDTEATR